MADPSLAQVLVSRVKRESLTCAYSVGVVKHAVYNLYSSEKNYQEGIGLIDINALE